MPQIFGHKWDPPPRSFQTCQSQPVSHLCGPVSSDAHCSLSPKSYRPASCQLLVNCWLPVEGNVTPLAFPVCCFTLQQQFIKNTSLLSSIFCNLIHANRLHEWAIFALLVSLFAQLGRHVRTYMLVPRRICPGSTLECLFDAQLV